MAKDLKPIRPNAGIAAAYRSRLETEIAKMHASLVKWLMAEYRKTETMAQDEAPIDALKAAMRRLSRKWQKNFDELAPKLADHFAKAASDRVDHRLKAMLREAGFTVKFAMSPEQREAYQAVVAENVSLIKSVAQKHLSDVEGAVMRSVSAGRDLGSLAKALQENYGVTRRRAGLIARTQNNMATAVLTRVRQQQAGITKARWLHSAGGKTPRPSHIKAGRDKTVYDVSKGWYDPDANEWIYPGQLINCRCVSIPVIDALT